MLCCSPGRGHWETSFILSVVFNGQTAVLRSSSSPCVLTAGRRNVKWITENFNHHVFKLKITRPQECKTVSE